MTPDTLEKALNDAVVTLLSLARELTWNKISNNCKFILSEIENSEHNFFEQRKLRKIENDNKTPAALQDLVPLLLKQYENLYDINLHIYKSTKDLTIIDIRYYPKSSIEEEFRMKIKDQQPMLHCKVSTPPYNFEKKEKFDINWEHNNFWHKWKMFWWKFNSR
jgi:hypothetical protein